MLYTSPELVSKKNSIYIIEIRDRKAGKDSNPLAYLLLDRYEQYRYDEGRITGAHVEIKYQRIRKNSDSFNGSSPDAGNFCAGYSKGFEREYVSLTSKSISEGAVFLDLPGLEGQRIGTYLMSALVEWAMQWPSAELAQFTLSSLQADEFNKDRRNRFYDNYNIKFDFHTPENLSGKSKKMLVSELTPVHTWKENIREISISNYIGQLLDKENSDGWELMRKDNVIKSLRQTLKDAEFSPLKWVMQQLWCRYGAWLLEGLIVVLAILGIVFFIDF